MRSRAVLCAVLAVAAIIALAVPGAVLGQSAGAPHAQQAQQATDAANRTVIAIHQRQNGDARFRITSRFVLNDTNESTAFGKLGEEFEAGETELSATPFRRAANQSSIVTGRTMNVTNVTRNATVVGENTTGADTGRLVLGFTWTNFGRTNGSRVFVGDAFNTTRGTWLPGLSANQTLRIDSPPGYIVTKSPTAFSNNTVEWTGPVTFQTGEPVVTFDRGPGNPQPPANDGSGMLSSMPLLVAGAGVVVIGAGIVLGIYALSRRDTEGRSSKGRVEAATTDKTTEPETPTENDVTDETDTTAAELLSDEERVERLLTANDGRMKQASIVDETGWSNAKVSQLLSAMDEAGRVDKLRIGRENLISLPDDD